MNEIEVVGEPIEKVKIRGSSFLRLTGSDGAFHYF